MGVILHDLGIRFNSPFVNLWVGGDDFVKVSKNLKEYMSEALCFIHSENVNFPVALLGDVKIWFQHYCTEEEALTKWNRRKERINYDSLFFMSTDIGANQKSLENFETIPHENKVIFTHLPHPEIKSAYYISGREKEDSVGVLTDFRPHKLGIRYIDEFDYVSWFKSSRQ